MQSDIIVALDFETEAALMQCVDALDPASCRVKIGKAVFTRFGPAMVTRIRNLGFDIFLDLKFHDIPNTVAGACLAAADLGVWMLNVHAQGGRRMMEAAREALARSQSQRPLLIAVTVLTSMTATDLTEIGITTDPATYVARLAHLTQESGLDGVVCSAMEASVLRKQCGDDFVLVTPGIRLSDASAFQDDQSRIMTPAAARLAGANYLVVGRPITAAADPKQVLLSIQPT